MKEGLLVTGNYNKSPYDRTLWYAITDKGYEVLGVGQNSQIDLPKNANESEENGRPIPDTIPDTIPDKEKENNNMSKSDDVGREQISSESLSKEDEIIGNFETLWSLYPKKHGKNQAYNHYRAWLKGRKFAGKTKKLTREQMWYAIKDYSDKKTLLDGPMLFTVYLIRM